jgi:hypothetical protein
MSKDVTDSCGARAVGARHDTRIRAGRRPVGSEAAVARLRAADRVAAAVAAVLRSR